MYIEHKIRTMKDELKEAKLEKVHNGCYKYLLFTITGVSGKWEIKRGDIQISRYFNTLKDAVGYIKEMAESYRLDFVAITGNMYMGEEPNNYTYTAFDAKRFNTWQEAQAVCEGTNWYYCQIYEIKELLQS